MASDPIWFYVSLDASPRKPLAVRVIGSVSKTGKPCLLVEPINQRMFNTSRLILVPSTVEAQMLSLDVDALLPVRAYDGARVDAEYLAAVDMEQLGEVLDIAGISPSRDVAERWARR
jgi:hypothetical protein